MPRGEARNGNASGASAGMPCQRFGAMDVGAHRDVGEDVLHAVPVLTDEVGWEPDTWFLFDRVHGNRVRRVGLIQYAAMFRAIAQRRIDADMQTAACR